MAKRRKEGAEVEESLDFQIPKFDEEGFMKKERRNIKTLFISFLFGLLIAVICFGFWVLLDGSFLRWELVLLVAVVNSIWIKYLFMKLNIDLTDFGRKGWLTAFVTYFFTWLLLLIVLVNPPFYDGESPHVDMVTLPGMQEPGGTILFAAYIVDNVGVNKAGITFMITDPNGTVSTPEFTYENNIFRYTYENPNAKTGTFNYTAIVSDVNNRKTTITGTFIYATDVLEIISSRFTGVMSGDAITINADKEISKVNFRVYYKIDNGSDINVNRKQTSDIEKYETTAEFKGWTTNSTVSVSVFAEARHYFLNIPEKFSNTVKDTHHYTFTTANDQNIGTEEPLVEWNATRALLRQSQLPNTLNYITPYPISSSSTPGFEVIVFLVAIVAVVFLLKRKKNNKRT
ncbi:MAG: PGF-CTERM sorting domain-containing protein [Euryarchaeota archaeon]|nr:PGF-CTERM sorting domain-containing protein [Euryarchaeota archaeon]